MEFTQKVISGGRITIPEFIREAMQIEEGDILKVEIEKVEGEI